MAESLLVAGQYRVGRRLAAGGLSRVWLAVDETDGSTVAIKRSGPPDGLSLEEADLVRGLSLPEARAFAAVDHPNVVRIRDVVPADGEPWIVMDYVPSQSLQQVVAGAFVDAHRGAQAARTGLTDGGSQQAARHEGDHPYLQMGGTACARGLQVTGPMAQVLQHGARSPERYGAKRCGLHAARRALEQRRAEQRFQFSQRLRDGGLAGGHVVGDAGERAVRLDLLQQHQVAHLQPRRKAGLNDLGGRADG